MEEDNYLANVYQRFPITIVKGKDAKVWDDQGNEYIDCMAGYGVAIVGHCNDRVVNAIKDQLDKLMICHPSCYNDARLNFLKELIRLAPNGLNKVFLSNSGAESIEAAIKIARKYTKKHGIIAMINSFHGKTMGALSLTYAPKYRSSFEPLLDGVKFVPFGNYEKLEESIDDTIGAVILEPIQGEGGIHLPPDDYLQMVRELCNKRNVLLIFDEIQAGLGRTGKLWACMNWNVTPDIMCLAKGLGGGIPIGATLTKEHIMNVLSLGDHSSTFGGNPIAVRAAHATLESLIIDDLINNASKMGKIFKDGLLNLKDKHKIIRDVRGLGLMLGVELRFEVKDILLDAIKHNLLLLYSGKNIIRLLPPLVIDEVLIRKALDIMDVILTNEEVRRNVR